MLHWIIIALYIFFLTFILAYCLAQLNLTFLYLKAKKAAIPIVTMPNGAPWPSVCIQLPVYNEKYVVERLLDSVAAIHYPNKQLEIQVLDDSSDETSELIAQKIVQLTHNGINIKHIQRPLRKDFKAGALQYGMEHTNAEFIAIFDADFLPKSDFLEKTVPYFKKPNIGVVQSRWGHLNQNYSLLTKLQSYVLNAHFTVDQLGRNFGGQFINFNGTAGIWRKSTIIDAGGWQGDTLTEDLDLSYRAQLKNWKFIYLENLESPAELPAEMNALKSQQFRWAKGAAECASKNLIKVFKQKDTTFSTKANAAFHLLNSFNWFCLMASSFLLLPFSYLLHQFPEYNNYLWFMGIYYISFISLFLYYFVSNSFINFKTPKDYLLFIASYPMFIALMMGLSLYNSIGVIEGYLGIRSSFIRTPKFNLTHSDKKLKGVSYVNFKPNFITVLEFSSIIYFSITAYYLYQFGNYHALNFTILMIIGLSFVLFFSIYHSVIAKGKA